MPQSQLPETINITEEEKIKIKSKPQIKKAKDESNIEGILDGELPRKSTLSSKPTMTATAA